MTKTWERRINNIKVIGRIYIVSPFDGDKFYLRILYNHVRGPSSFQDLRTVNGELQQTFKEAAEKRGLLENDNNIRHCMYEASLIRMSSALKRLFVTILVYSQPTRVRQLWDEFHIFMVEDYTYPSGAVDNTVIDRLLRDLNRILEQFDKSTKNFDLPEMTSEQESNIAEPRCIEDELSIYVTQEDINAINHLNLSNRGGLFFVDGPGGTEKTYLYRALLANLRSMRHIVLATASSRIATTILNGGRTTHSRFKIPLDVKDPNVVYN